MEPANTHFRSFLRLPYFGEVESAQSETGSGQGASASGGQQPRGWFAGFNITLIKGFAREDVDQAQFICVLCKGVLRNTYQTPIGDRACKSCLVNAAFSESSRLSQSTDDDSFLKVNLQMPQSGDQNPEDCEPFFLNQCSPDMAFTRQSAKDLMMLKCPVKNCEWPSGTLLKLYEHASKEHSDLEKALPNWRRVPTADEVRTITRPVEAKLPAAFLGTCTQKTLLKNFLEMDLSDVIADELIGEVDQMYLQEHSKSATTLSTSDYRQFLVSRREALEERVYILICFLDNSTPLHGASGGFAQDPEAGIDASASASRAISEALPQQPAGIGCADSLRKGSGNANNFVSSRLLDDLELSDEDLYGPAPSTTKQAFSNAGGIHPVSLTTCPGASGLNYHSMENLPFSPASGAKPKRPVGEGPMTSSGLSTSVMNTAPISLPVQFSRRENVPSLAEGLTITSNTPGLEHSCSASGTYHKNYHFLEEALEVPCTAERGRDWNRLSDKLFKVSVPSLTVSQLQKIVDHLLTESSSANT